MAYPTLILKNQFGEQSNNYVLNGSSQIDLSFTVTPTDSSGAGVSSLTDSGDVTGVFMHSTATFAGDTHTNKVIDNISDTSFLEVGMLLTGTGIVAGTKIASITSATAILTDTNTSATNTNVTFTYAAPYSPNPAAGYILVQLSKNYLGYLNNSFSIETPQSGTPINVTTGVTAGLAYVITSLGNTSASQWLALGVPAGVTPAVGVSFVAPITTTATGTGAIQVPKAGGSGIVALDVIGNPNYSVAATIGSQVLLRCLAAGSAAPTLTMNSYTPAGTNSVPTFTGSALGTHTHSIPPGTDGSGGTSGATSGGTPAGTISAATFTGSAATLTGTISAPSTTLAIAAPSTSSIITLKLVMLGAVQQGD